LKLEEQGGLPDIGFWDNSAESISWSAQITKPGSFKVSATVATQNANARFVVDVGGNAITAQAPMTGGWDKFQTIDLGQIQIPQSGDLTVTVRAKDIDSWKAINLNSVQLTLAN